MSDRLRRFGRARYAADRHYQRALTAWQDGRLPEARLAAENAIEMLPSQAEYQALLGWLLLEDDARAAALAAFDAALAQSPYDMLANYGRGRLAYADKDWDGAAGCFLSALAAQPERPETHYYLALVRHRQHQNGPAFTWMEGARDRFAAADDPRQDHCRLWLREFEKLLRDEMTPNASPENAG